MCYFNTLFMLLFIHKNSTLNQSKRLFYEFEMNKIRHEGRIHQRLKHKW